MRTRAKQAVVFGVRGGSRTLLASACDYVLHGSNQHKIVLYGDVKVARGGVTQTKQDRSAPSVSIVVSHTFLPANQGQNHSSTPVALII